MIWTGREERTWGFRTGENITGDLVVEERLGGGHEYESYRAQDGPSRTRVVVKLVRPHLVDESHPVTGLRREAMVMDGLEHPSIPEMLRAQLDGDKPHLVLSHCEGRPLDEIVSSEGMRTDDVAVETLRPIARALAYLSERSIVHLDVKPQNVIVGSTPRLIDFGLARSHQEAARIKSPSGSDPYMAPERCVPGGEGIGAPADVWGLGATLFFALTAGPPFRRPVPWSKPEERWPQLVADLELPSHLSSGMQELLHACLERDPKRRKNIAEAVALLEAHR